MVIQPFVYFLPHFCKIQRDIRILSQSSHSRLIKNKRWEVTSINFSNRVSHTQKLRIVRDLALLAFLVELEKQKLHQKVFVYSLKVSQPFYFHILAGAEETCITNCYSEINQKHVTLHRGSTKTEKLKPGPVQLMNKSFTLFIWKIKFLDIYFTRRERARITTRREK